jgi:hypothetical protein
VRLSGSRFSRSADARSDRLLWLGETAYVRGILADLGDVTVRADLQRDEPGACAFALLVGGEPTDRASDEFDAPAEVVRLPLKGGEPPVERLRGAFLVRDLPVGAFGDGGLGWGRAAA